MHEMPVAQAIVEQAVQAAAARGATSIQEIEVDIGRMRLIVPEALELAFSCCACGTIAEGAKLTMIEVAVEARCRACGRQFSPELDLYLCPGCGLADVAITAGNDMVLKSIVCQTPDEKDAQ